MESLDTYSLLNNLKELKVAQKNLITKLNKSSMSKKTDIGQVYTEIAVMAEKISNIERVVADIQSKLDSNYATKEWVNSEYGQTRKIVNATIVTFGTAIILALAAFIIRGGLK